MTSPFRRRVVRPVQEFLQTEAASGIVLLGATAAALALANLPFRDSYRDVLEWHLTIGIGDASITETLHGWVNDGLMTLFFFVVGLEIRRELAEGELRDPKTAALPVIGAAGGMALPALLYFVVNAGEPTARGWGIPMATDIAFAVGVVVLLGPRVPSALKVLLLTLAIADDVGGILVIAIFYTDALSGPWLGGAVAGVLVIWAMLKSGIRSIPPYVVLAGWIWVAAFESGIHPTIAGVTLGLMTPVARVRQRHILHQLEHRLHPWSSFVVIPLFALANAGIELGGDVIRDAFNARVTWGIILGLVVGKVLGVTLAIMAGVRAGIGRLPDAITTSHVVGMGLISGIGFTVAIFIANLSFKEDAAVLDQAKIGVVMASVLAAILGVLWLTRVAPRADAHGPEP